MAHIGEALDGTAARESRFGHDFGLVRLHANASSSPHVSGVLQRAPAGPTPADLSAELARVRGVLEDAKAVASDLVEETTGTTINTGRGGGRRPRATRQRTERILTELESIANNPAVPEARREAAVRLHAEIEGLSNEIRAAEIERARVVGAPKTMERAAERAAANLRQETAGIAEFKAAKVEGKGAGAAVKTTTSVTGAAKAESAIAGVASAELKAAKGISRVGSSLVRLGALGFELLLPGPLDALALLIQFAGSYAEAREAIRSRNTRTGFAIGLSAFLLGRAHRAVRKHLSRKFVLDRDVHTQIVGAVGIAEKSHNDGLDAGFNYGGLLSDEAKDALREAGFSILAAQGRLPERNELFAAEGVWRLAGALHDAVDQIFEAMQVQAEKQRQEERRKLRQEEYRVGMKV